MHYVHEANPPVADKALAACTIYIDGLIGALQWCSGPNVPDKDIGTVRSSIFAISSSAKSKRGQKIAREPYHFKLYWHGKPTNNIDIDELNAQLFDTFETLCSDEKVRMCYDQPFEQDLSCREGTTLIVSKIRDELRKLSGEYVEPEPT